MQKAAMDGFSLASAAAGEAAVANVVAGPTIGVLRAIRHERVGLALWWRALCPVLARSLELLLEGPLFAAEGSGPPEVAVTRLLEHLPGSARILAPDLDHLAQLFAATADTTSVRIRLDHVAGRTCPKLHVDAVRVRLLCTYAGRGTEWEDARRTVRRMPAGHVALLKGSRWPGCDTLVRHRSPAVSGLSGSDRRRLLLVIDEADAA